MRIFNRYTGGLILEIPGDSSRRGADLRGADLRDADLSDADLSGANLSRANLRGADLREADLRDADLSDANLSGANLSGADMSGAVLSWADLSGANLSRADLSGAVLDFSSWPLWCGGTRVKIGTRLSLQLIYHAFNQDHQDPEIRAALEPLRPLAQWFKNEFRADATPIRGE